jgi:lambda repressor-like predicted transcriptional regulator
MHKFDHLIRNWTAKTEAEKATLQNAVDKTDQDMDELVYELYGLTPEEIKLVEAAK